jgi:hypothetical protein
MKIFIPFALIIAACSSTPATQSSPQSSVPAVAPKLTDSQRIDIWFSFHKEVLQKMASTKSIVELNELSLDAREIQKAAERDILSWPITPEEKEKKLYLLQVARGEEILQWASTRDKIQCQTTGTLSYAKSTVAKIHESISTEDSDEQLVDKIFSAVQCLAECTNALPEVEYFELYPDLKELAASIDQAIKKATLVSEHRRNIHELLQQPFQ